jgi:hypothetical protein
LLGDHLDPVARPDHHVEPTDATVIVTALAWQDVPALIAFMGTVPVEQGYHPLLDL